MRVSREKFAENRARILEVAGELFREKGFDGIGVADIMKAAGLTHGGFYGHFDSKDEPGLRGEQGAGRKDPGALAGDRRRRPRAIRWRPCCSTTCRAAICRAAPASSRR